MRLAASVVALVVCVHAGLWTLLRDETKAPNVDGPLASLSYQPPYGKTRPGEGPPPTAAQIRTDLKAIAPYTRAIRTYSTTCGAELVPGVATEFDLRVSVGAWVKRPDEKDKEQKCRGLDRSDRDDTLSEREVRGAIDLAKKHRNVNSLVVGNEAIYTGAMTPDPDFVKAIVNGTEAQYLRDMEAARKKVETLDPEDIKKIRQARTPEERAKVTRDIGVARLIKIIQRAKRESPVPVTTGEVWSIWRDYPELVASVDFITVHVLPYWEGRSSTTAVDDAIGAYNLLRRLYPGKRVVIGEFGWPSAGYNLKEANPGRIEQAEVLRDFVTRAEALGIDYNVIEATDQPWKIDEGSVGSYWGLFDTNLRPKFAWTGPVTHSEHWKLGGLALLLGFLLSLPILRLSRATAGEAALLGVCANAVGAWCAAIFGFWDGHYFVFGTAFSLGLGSALLVPLMLIALSRMEE